MPAPKGNKFAVGNSGGGRSTDYRRAYVRIARKMCELGATDTEIADALDIHVQTLYDWKLRHKEFSLALKAGKDISDERVERSLYARACGYNHDAIHFSAFQGMVTATPYREHVPPDPTSMIFWLKNRQPQKWRDIRALEHTGKDGGPIQAQVMAAQMDEGKLRALIEKLEAAQRVGDVVDVKQVSNGEHKNGSNGNGTH